MPFCHFWRRKSGSDRKATQIVSEPRGITKRGGAHGILEQRVRNWDIKAVESGGSSMAIALKMALWMLVSEAGHQEYA